MHATVTFLTESAYGGIVLVCTWKQKKQQVTDPLRFLLLSNLKSSLPF